VFEETQIQKHCEGYIDAVKQYLSSFGLTKICPSTYYNWLRRLGFNYCAQKKNYFVDGHEKAATIAYRVKFIPRYFDYERRTF
jgi:hypothetical protein